MPDYIIEFTDDEYEKVKAAATLAGEEPDAFVQRVVQEFVTSVRAARRDTNTSQHQCQACLQGSTNPTHHDDDCALRFPLLNGGDGL
jgi:hypothetical protein